jgi:hypothetical protein
MNKVHPVSTETIRNVHMINCSIESNFDANPQAVTSQNSFDFGGDHDLR